MREKTDKLYPPSVTIKNIRNILYNTELFVSEHSDSHDDFFHSHLWIANEGISHLKISTNGKGKNPEFSLASAYAEMMERLQNNLKFYGERYCTKNYLETLPKDSEFRKKVEQNDLVLQFESFHDEKHFKICELVSNENSACFKLFGEENINYLKQNMNVDISILCVPYYNVFEKKLDYLPVKNEKTGSNGMCAGNSLEEALIQGICEVFERYVLKKVLLDDIVLPQIPLELFIGTLIYDRIVKLRDNKSIEVIILDGSLGLGLPVIGCIIIDKIAQKYRLEMGSATDPEIALERCLTEHFQGYRPIEYMNNLYKRNCYSNRSDVEIKYINFYHQMINGDAELNMPSWLFKEPSYKHKELFNIRGVNHKKKLKVLLSILDKNHFKILVRDNSILGFPAYHVYIPGMSEVYNILNDDDVFVNRKLFDYLPMLYNIKKQSKEDIQKLSIFMDQIYGKVRPELLTIRSEFLYNTSNEIEDIKSFLFLANLYYFVGNRDKAIDYLDKFIYAENKIDPESDLDYFRCARQYIELSKVFDLKTIKLKLNQLFNSTIVVAVTEDLSNPSDSFKHYELPTCFDCEICPIKLHCKYFDVMKVVKKIQNYSILNIDQSKLKHVFT